MATNEYGLDVHYMSKKLKTIQQGIDRYTPDEMFRALSGLAMTAANQAGISVKMKIKWNDE